MGDIVKRPMLNVTPGGNPVCEKCREIGGPGHRCKPLRDPTEWRPRNNSDWERVEANQQAESMRSLPLHYQSLAQHVPEHIAAIEATARAELIRAMDQQGLYPDERGIRVHWQLVVEGYGFRMPEGFIHPEAPDDVKAEGRRAWKRVVEIASDSMVKFMFVQVWRRRRRLGAGPSQPREIESNMAVLATSDDEETD